MSENKVRNEVLKRLGGSKDVRLFRNNVGMGFVGNAIVKNSIQIILKSWRIIKFGLFKGSGDLIGWKTVYITPNMVGKKIAVFLSIETKKPKGGKYQKEQIIWAKNVNDAGGIAVFINDPENIVLKNN